MSNPIFSWDARKGTLIDSVSKTAGTLTAGSGGFRKTEKGLALKYDGSTTTLDTGVLSNAILGATDGYIEIWFRTGSNVSTVQYLNFFQRSSGSTFQNLVISGGYLKGYYANNAAGVDTTSISSTTTLQPNANYHAVFSRSATVNVYLYVNSVLEDSATNGGQSPAAFNLWLGSTDTGANKITASLIRVRAGNHTPTQSEVNEMYKEFLNSYGTEKPVRNFTYPKPTDLSSEVDSKLEEEFSDDFSTDTTGSYSGVNQKSKTYNDSDESMTVVGDGAGYITVVKSGVIDTSETYKVIIRAKSSTKTTTLGIWSGTSYQLSSEILSTEYQNFIIDDFSANTTTMTIRPNITYAEDDDLTISDIYLYSKHGLVAAYSFGPETVSNGTLVDVSGNGNNGTISGALLSKDGIKFDGVDDRVNISGLNDDGRDMTLAFRAMKTTSNGRYLQIGSGTFIYTSGSTLTVTRDNTSTSVSTSSIIDSDKFYNIIVTSTSAGLTNVYVNGANVASGTIGVSPFGVSSYIGYTLNGFYFDGVISDFKFYNYAFTPQQCKDYHNSFIKPTLIEDFSNEGADGVVKTPKGWIKSTGSYKVDELAIEQGNLFDVTSLATGWTNPSGNNLIATAPIVQYVRAYFTDTLEAGHRYRVNYTVNSISPGAGNFVIAWTSGGGPIFGTLTTTGSGSFESTCARSTDKISIYPSLGDLEIDIDIDSVTEIPPLPDLDTGTKYLENTSAGTTAIQSKQAYGEWEFDFYKGAGGNAYYTYITSNKLDVTTASGYLLGLLSTEVIRFYKINSGSGSILIDTATSYIANNTWYRLKVARLQSEGVFKDIPTLQTSDTVNSSVVPYDSFTSNGKYGFSVVGDGLTSEVAGTTDELSIVNTSKYLVEFDLKLNSGTAPQVVLNSDDGSGTSSNVGQSVNGRNSIILTATNTATMRCQFRNLSTATDYEVSGLTIRRIYDANTFAAFIKGGSFGNIYTLVDVTGGVGQNPISDSSYTSSKYCVIDLDAGDRITNLITHSEVKQ